MVIAKVEESHEISEGRQKFTNPALPICSILFLSVLFLDIHKKKKAAGNVQYLKTKTFRYTHYKIVQTLTTDMHGVTKKMSIQQADRLCTETI